MKSIAVVILALACVPVLAQTPEKYKSQEAKNEADGMQQESHALAPRSAMLEGTANYGSKRGLYVITFPPPNECVISEPIRAVSRVHALYEFTTRGGFTLKPSGGTSLTVWTIEEWEQATKELPANWKALKDAYCKTK